MVNPCANSIPSVEMSGKFSFAVKVHSVAIFFSWYREAGNFLYYQLFFVEEMIGKTRRFQVVN